MGAVGATLIARSFEDSMISPYIQMIFAIGLEELGV